MSSKKTNALINLIERRAAEANSWQEAQHLIEEGADIRVRTKNGSMIDSVINEEKRHQQPSPWKAQNCRQLIQLLQNHASQLLATMVLSSNGGNVNELLQLINIHASCYQSEKYGILGLLGELLKQETIPIRPEIVQCLVENDPNVKFSLTKINDKQQTCLSISKANPKCSQDVRKYLQHTFDLILNRIPSTHGHMDVNEIAEWIHRGANPEVTDERGNTVLLNAVIAKNQALVEKLVGVGCNTSHVNKDKLTALQLAENATPRNAQLEAILKSQNINIELQKVIETKKSHLTFNEVNSLLEKGAKINTTITDKNTFLHLLITNEGTPEMLTTFINDFNADLSAMNIHGHRPIETCILHDKNPFILLQTYLKISKIPIETYYNSKLKKSILDFAKEQNRPEAIKIIQDALNLRLWNIVAQANTNDEHNRNLISQVNQVIQYGAEIEYKHSDNEYQDWTVLHLACKTTTKSFVQFLIEIVKAKYTIPNGNDDYPLSIAAEYGHLSIVQYLHELPNVQINISNKSKQTPLHLATQNHHLLVVRYLVLWGADYQAKNLNQQTPLDIARTNISKNKKDETTDKILIHFLEQLICPAEINQQHETRKKPNYDLDTCELIKPFHVEQIQVTTLGDEERLGIEKRGFLSSTANDNFITATKDGSIELAKAALGQGANICYRKNNLNAYEIATHTIKECNNQIMSNQSRPLEWQKYQNKLMGCQQILALIQQTAYNKLTQAINESVSYRVLAYHQAGAPLPVALLNYACSQTDNVQIVDYLINQSSDIFQAMFTNPTNHYPYYIAKKNKFLNVASYLKYRLSVECTKGIRLNDIEYVKTMIRAGASVDMHDTNNLQIALDHQNPELIEILCENGAKMPIEWLQSKTILLPENIAKTMKSDIVFRINRSLIKRRLRFSAANGDLQMLIQCQHLSADINSKNCYGSTALLCSIQYGNYFPIVHSLVSRGGTILHSNDNENISLIALAKKYNYTQIADYLSKELNTQFLNTIVNNDTKSAEQFEALGADFSCCDEQKRTPLHYAVQYHGIELVSWFCLRGSTPTAADINGNYPIIEATEKGDYAVVELFATKYPATKQHKNKAGQTALQIAQKLGFKRIAYLLETGQPAPESMTDSEPKPDGPKHTQDQLYHAAKNGHLRIIKEFMDDSYESIDEKRALCYQLIDIAKKSKQHEVVNILKPYYDKQLKATLPSDIEKGGVIRLNQHYKKILLGFLTGLGKVIADSPVALDPADPNTYTNLFSHMNTYQKERAQEIHKVSSERDIKQLSDKDLSNINEKLTDINNELNKLNEEKFKLEKEMTETTEKLKTQEELTATQRHELYKQQDEHKKQLYVYESSIFLYELQQEATIARQNTINFIQQNPNMYLFFRTIENLLQALFHGTLAARSGLLTTETVSKYATAASVVDALPTSLVPFSEPILGAIQKTVSKVLSKLDEREQKKEYYNIATLGDIEELTRIASDTASLVTLYYKEQIQPIDTKQKIKGSNTFNSKINFIKSKLIDVRPESNGEMPIIIVAEYVTEIIVDTLHEHGQKFSKVDPLPQQLWFHLAKEDFLEQRKATDVIGTTTGQQRIPIKIQKTTNGKETTVYIQLRYLIGCVSLVTNDGNIYQYPITKEFRKELREDLSKEDSKEFSDEDLLDLNLFGYVYVTPFISDENKEDKLNEIIEERKLIKSHRDDKHNILTKFKDIEQYAKNFQRKADRDRESLITVETARQIAVVLREEKTFLDRKTAETILNDSQQKTENNINILRDDIQKKQHFYQISIDATSEKLQKQLTEAQDTLEKDNEKHYHDTFKRLNEQLDQISKQLESQIVERMNTVEKQMKTECNEMRKIVEAAKKDSEQALIKANEAVQASQQSAEHSQKAQEHAKQLVQSMEERKQEFQAVMDKCQTNVQQTITEQKQSCEQTITALRTKVQQDFERTKSAAEQSAISSKESLQAARDTAKATQEIQKDARRQLDVQKEETNRIIAEVKEITKQNERSANEAKDANKQSKQSADASTSTFKKAEEMQKKMENALERVEKLAKKIETK